MPPSSHLMILNAYCERHRRILQFAEPLTDAQLTWQAAPGTLCIAFYLWHLGRWADHIQAATPGMTEGLRQRLLPGEQLWEKQNLAGAWGFDQQVTGYAETGMDMDEANAVRLRFPSKEVLLAYVRAAFEAAERATQAIDEEQFFTLEQPQPITEGIFSDGGTVGDAYLVHMLHDAAHFGMMSALLGLQTAGQREQTG